MGFNRDGEVVPKGTDGTFSRPAEEYRFLEYVLLYVHEIWGCEGKLHPTERCRGPHAFSAWSWQYGHLIVAEFQRR